MDNNSSPGFSSSSLWHFRLPSYAAVRYAKQAIEAIDARMQATNPIDDLEEMQYMKQYRDALLKALSNLSPIIRDMNSGSSNPGK